MAPEGNSAEGEVAHKVRVRLRNASIASNLVGALVVFAFAALVLPIPKDVHDAWRLLALNGALFAAVMFTGVTSATLLLDRRIWTEQLGWVDAGREPDERERRLALRFPLTQHAVIAVLWGLAAVVFGVFNVFFSPQLAVNVAITVLIGGQVTVALGYLLSERLLRPVMAMALASGLPPRPQLPGVTARALLSWTLGTGDILFGLMLVALGVLVEGNLTTLRLAIVVLILSAIGMTVGLLTMIGLARSLSEPVVALRQAVGAVERGEFDHDVKVDDGSEVGLLQAGFNRMVAGLREREEIRDLFGRQVGEDVVRHALEHGVELGGEAREAAVLFVDLQGSTELAHTRDPADVVRILNDFFAIVVEVVGQHDGWVNKFEGDAALCAFGVPLEDAAAATESLAAGRELSARLRDQLSELTAGMGVSAGRVVAGDVGAAKRFEYTVIGDPVNESARLSDLAKANSRRVLASGAALARADEQERGRWEICDEPTLRGRSEATEIATPRDAGGGGRNV